MIQLLVFSFLLASATSIAYPSIPKFSAASPAQIRFAYENKFDDTGPGAKEPEYAYQVFNNIDDALVAYVGDPDTQLPEHEKARAIANLYRNDNVHKMNTFAENRPKILPMVLNSYAKFNEAKKYAYPGQESSRLASRWRKEGSKPSTSFSSQYFHYQNKPHPDVEFSVDVHDKETGDLKTARELRDGSGTVHGYYTFLEHSRNKRSARFGASPPKGYKSYLQTVY